MVNSCTLILQCLFVSCEPQRTEFIRLGLSLYTRENDSSYNLFANKAFGLNDKKKKKRVEQQYCQINGRESEVKPPDPCCLTNKCTFKKAELCFVY